MPRKSLKLLSDNLQSRIAEHCQQTGDSLKQLAARIDSGEDVYLWLRRINSQGVQRTNKRTVQRLDKLAEVLGTSICKLAADVPDITPADVMSCLRKDHLRQWCLWVAWQMSLGRGMQHTHEMLATLIEQGIPHTDEERRFRDHFGIRDEAKNFAQFFAKLIDCQLCIVSKLTHPELWEIVKKHNLHE